MPCLMPVCNGLSYPWILGPEEKAGTSPLRTRTGAYSTYQISLTPDSTQFLHQFVSALPASKESLEKRCWLKTLLVTKGRGDSNELGVPQSTKTTRLHSLGLYFYALDYHHE